MRSKTDDDQSSILQWLFERGEETLVPLVHELLGRRGASGSLAKMIEQAARTKGRLDRNAELLLHLLNLPTRADYERLALKIQHLQGSLINLNMKLDRLLAAAERRRRSPKPLKPEN